MLTLAASDATVLAAFAAGFVSFISPCVLPLVPGYLSAISGVSFAEIRDREHSPAMVLLPALLFCLSFSFMFIALGMTGDRPRRDAQRPHRRPAQDRRRLHDRARGVLRPARRSCRA